MTLSQTGQKMPKNDFSLILTAPRRLFPLLSHPAQQGCLQKASSCGLKSLQEKFQDVPDIKSFFKPIHTPKVTVRNPYAKDTKGGGHTHSFPGLILSPQAISAKKTQ